jgi:single-strand DNA-binding protein
MQGINRTTLLGNLGADPELKYTPTGQAVLRLRLGTSESYPDKNGQRQERTDWHNVVVWGKRAEALHQMLRKGRSLYIEGRNQTRSWDGKDGEKRYATDVVATNVILLGGPRAGQEQHARQPPEGEASFEEQNGDAAHTPS